MLIGWVAEWEGQGGLQETTQLIPIDKYRGCSRQAG